MPPGLPDLPPIKPNRPKATAGRKTIPNLFSPVPEGEKKAKKSHKKKPAASTERPRIPVPRLSDLPGPAVIDTPAFVPATAADLPDLFRAQTRDERIAAEAMEIAGELLQRRKEALGLYEPLPVQDDFHRSRIKTRLLRGSTRGGKTLPAAVELARAVLGTDPYGKYPRSGIAYIIGSEYSHHGTVIYPKLFKPGAFKVVRDAVTGDWRAFQPWRPEDAGREPEAVDAEPLIPERFVSDVAWEDKKKEIPSVVHLTTGWIIYFWSGKTIPPRGQAIDIGWMDEEIGRESWHPELVSRSLDRNGYIWWSAAPQTGTQILYDLSEQAQTELDDAGKVVEEFIIRLRDNPHISDAAKGVMSASLSDAEREVRIEGEFALAGTRVYPEWSTKIHGYPWFEIPASWTRYAVIDPGHQICAALFGAVPPPGDPRKADGDLFLYDELYIARCNAGLFAERFAAKARNQMFHEFLIDRRGSRVHEAGSGKTIADQYAEALAKLGVRSKVTGSGFNWGSDNLKAGILSVRGYLKTRHGGPPRLRVLTMRMGASLLEKCSLPNFEWEVMRYHFLRKKELITDETDERGRVHLMADLRYLCAHEPRWHQPEAGKPPPSEAWLAVQAKRKAGGRRIGVTFGPDRESEP